MSIFESLDDHAIWEQLEVLKSQAYDLEIYTPQGLVALQVLKTNLDYIDWCLHKSNPSLLSLTMLNNISGQLRTIEGAVELLRTNPSSEDPNTINQNTAQMSAISKAINTISQVLPYPRVQQIFRTEANAAIEEVEQNAKATLAGLTEAQKKASTEVTKKTTDLEAEIRDQKTLIQDQDTQLKALQQKVADTSASLDAIGTAKTKEFDVQITERKEQLAEWSTSIESQGEGFLTEIQNMYRLAGDTTLSGRFLAAADSEWRGYLATTVIAVLFFVGAILVTVMEWLAGASFLRDIFADPILLFLSRISLIAVFLLPATVFAANSAKHRRAEVWLRTMGVRIATLKPYLDELQGGDDYKEELKKIILSFFVSEIRIEPRQNTGLLGKMSGKIDVDQIPDFIEKIKAATLK